MISPKHIIVKQVLDIRLSDQENAHEIQNEFSRVYRTAVIPALDMKFDQLVKDDEVIKIDKLEIDIGRIALADLEHQFPEKVQQELEKVLSKQLHQVRAEMSSSSIAHESPDLDSSPTIQLQTLKASRIEQIMHFLQSGLFPWWAEQEPGYSIAAITRQVIVESPEEFRQGLMRQLISPTIRKRLIYQFSDKLIEQVLQLFNRDCAKFLVSLYWDLKVVQRQKRFVQLSDGALRLAVWDIGIQYVIKKARSQVNGKADVQLDKKAKQEYIAQLIEDLAITSRKTKGKDEAVSEALVSISQSIHALKGNKIAFRTPAFISMIKAIVTISEFIDDYAKGGKTKFAEEDRTKSDQKLDLKKPQSDKEIRDEKLKLRKKEEEEGYGEKTALKKEKDMSAKALAQEKAEGKGQKEKYDELELKRKKIDENFDKEADLVGKRDKKDQDEESILKREKVEAKEHEVTKSQRTRNEKKLDAEPELGDRKKKDDEQSELGGKEGLLVNETEETIPLGKSVQLEDDLLEEEKTIGDSPAITEGYVENAGLVILWPYLSQFFKELKLVEGKSFVNEEANHKAVHILQFLVTGNEEETPEYELILNKLMCAVDISEPLITGNELNPTDKKECENMLEAVIENWTTLKNTSVDGFRDSFLKRQGILTREDAGWLVKLERSSFDMLLDSLPWPISIIKLPWNDNTIYVEW